MAEDASLRDAAVPASAESGHGIALPAEPPVAEAAPPKLRRKRKLLWFLSRHLFAALVSTVIVVVVIGAVAFLAISGRPVNAPDWVVDKVEARVNDALAGQGRMDLRGIELTIDKGLVPRLRLRDMALWTKDGQSLVLLPDVRTTLDAAALMRGTIRPQRLRISGGALTAHRRVDGSFDLNIGAPQGAHQRGASLTDLLESLDAVFATPALSALESAEITGLELVLKDDRAGRLWRVKDGTLNFSQTPDNLAIALGFDMETAMPRKARAELEILSNKTSPRAALTARVTGVPSADLAAQVPALAFLAALDAPISGSLSGGLDGTGAVGAVEGTLDIGHGVLQPAPATKPVAFDRGRLRFAYEPAAQRLRFSQVEIDSKTLRLRAEGHAYLRDFASGLPQELQGQVQISDLRVDPQGMFASPVTLDRGAADLRLRLKPFSIDFGQVALLDETGRIDAKGRIMAGEKGWETRLDIAVDAIRHDRMLALWPVSLVPNTRRWIEENVQEGLLSNVQAALRLAPGAPLRATVSYEFAKADVSVLKTLPPIRSGTGYATVTDQAYTMYLSEGHIDSPQGGAIDAAGSVFSVPDITVRPARAEITLKTDSSITAALSLLDQPPFNFVSKAGRDVDLAEGRAVMETALHLTLRKKLKPEEVVYSVRGKLNDVSSDRVVPGRDLRADTLSLAATPAGMDIAGKGTLSGIPFDAQYRMGFRPEDRGKANVTGRIELSPRALDAFDIDLPEGSVSGTGSGNITVDLVKGAAPRFTLNSGLQGIALTLAGTGWSKGANDSGKLDVTGTLGQPPVVEKLRVESAGLTAEGNITVAAGGGLEKAEFTTLRIGKWLDGQAALTGRGKGASVAIALTGGTLDIRRFPEGAGGTGSSDPVEVRLDSLRVSEAIRLENFAGRFTTAGGLKGKFTARVNGGAPVAGTVAPASGGTALRVTSEDAGGVFASAGIFSKGKGGALDLVLAPRGQPGNYDGRLTANGMRVKKAPVLADLLSAISVIGLLEQLNGDGILFSDVRGEFRLTPDALEISKGSAVGASLGVSLAGLYTFADNQVNLQGVVSPIYLVNGIGAILSRRGEGLFGFNYRISGDAVNPRVGVNPLSVLTPGMFREIFRRPPPKLE